MLYLTIFSLIALLSFSLSLAVKKFAIRLKIFDKSDMAARKEPREPVPLLGGLAPFLAFFIAVGFFYFAHLLPAKLSVSLFWLFLASSIIMFGGALDDKFNLKPRRQIIFPLAAIGMAVYGGARIYFITNPTGGIIILSVFASVFLSFFWLLLITYTTKILDGLDGLVGGITSLGAIAIFFFVTLSEFKEPSLAYLGIALAASFLGFLFLNIYPARLFLGEGGSLFAGFILGSLAIIGGAKIAVTLMVLALPLIDLIVVILKRWIGRKSIFSGDRLHLHFLLVDRGWKPQTVVYLFWFLSAALGAASIFLPSFYKVAALVLILIIFFFADMGLTSKKS